MEDVYQHLEANIIHVLRPVGYASTQTQYVIEVSVQERSWTVYRRFSEFRQLKKRLDKARKRQEFCSTCDKVSTEPFCHRRLFLSTADYVISKRRKRFQNFLQEIVRKARVCSCMRSYLNEFLLIADMYRGLPEKSPLGAPAVTLFRSGTAFQRLAQSRVRKNQESCMNNSLSTYKTVPLRTILEELPSDHTNTA